MKKNFGKKTILATLPVLIVATYDENGIPDAMNVAWGGQCSAHQAQKRQTDKCCFIF